MVVHKILLVEDDVILASALKEYLEDHGLEVFWAEDGEKALEVYEEECPNLVLLDIILPKKNGFEVIEAIRENDHYIPIVLMTGTEVEPESEVKGYKLGAVNYLRKPVLPMVVLALVQRLLDTLEVENYTLGCYQITLQKQLLQVGGKSFHLRERDIQVLSLLLRNQGRVVPRKHLMQLLWQDDDHKKNILLDSAVSRLRKACSAFPEIVIQGLYGEGHRIYFQEE